MLTEEQVQDIFELADILSASDRELFIQLREVIFATDPNVILNSLEQILDEKAFDAFLDKIGESEKDNLWLILMTLLHQEGFITTFKQQEQLEEFIQAFDRLPQVRQAGILLKLDSAGLLPSGSVTEWAAVVDGKYANENFCLGGIQVTAEENYLFFNTIDQFRRVKELATNLGYRVDYAKYL